MKNSMAIIFLGLLMFSAAVSSKADIHLETVKVERISGGRVTITLRAIDSNGANVSYHLCERLLIGSECQTHPLYNSTQGALCRNLWYDESSHSLSIVAPDPGGSFMLRAKVVVPNQSPLYSDALSVR